MLKENIIITYISPANNFLAADTVYVIHYMLSSRKVLILIRAQGYVHPEMWQYTYHKT